MSRLLSDVPAIQSRIFFVQETLPSVRQGHTIAIAKRLRKGQGGRSLPTEHTGGMEGGPDSLGGGLQPR